MLFPAAARSGSLCTKEAQVAVAALSRERRNAFHYEAPREINVGRIERWLSMAAGGLLAAYALKRRDTTAGAAAIGSATLLYRGATGHCQVYGALGVNRAKHQASMRGTGVIADQGSDTRRRL